MDSLDGGERNDDCVEYPLCRRLPCRRGGRRQGPGGAGGCHEPSLPGIPYRGPRGRIFELLQPDYSLDWLGSPCCLRSHMRDRDSQWLGAHLCACRLDGAAHVHPWNRHPVPEAALQPSLRRCFLHHPHMPTSRPTLHVRPPRASPQRLCCPRAHPRVRLPPARDVVHRLRQGLPPARQGAQTHATPPRSRRPHRRTQSRAAREHHCRRPAVGRHPPPAPAPRARQLLGAREDRAWDALGVCTQAHPSPSDGAPNEREHRRGAALARGGDGVRRLEVTDARFLTCPPSHFRTRT